MSGVFPSINTVGAGSANNAEATVSTVVGCNPLYYPSDCSAPVDGDSLNAIISEIVNLVNCGGVDYDCSLLDNMCRSVEAMICNGTLAVGEGVPAAAANACPKFYWDSVAKVFYLHDGTGWESVTDAGDIVARICASPAAVDALSDCLVSPDAGNQLVSSGNGLYVPPIDIQELVSDLCADSIAKDLLADCLVSPAVGNQLVSDGNGLFVNTPGPGGSITSNTPLTGLGTSGSPLGIDIDALATAICGDASAVATLQGCIGGGGGYIYLVNSGPGATHVVSAAEAGVYVFFMSSNNSSAGFGSTTTFNGGSSISISVGTGTGTVGQAMDVRTLTTGMTISNTHSGSGSTVIVGIRVG